MGKLDGNTKKVRVGGQLLETSQEELKNLAAKARSQVPVSPAAAAALGANPDQAKMAGVDDQKAAAVATNINVAPQNDLATAKRQEAPREKKTEDEQKLEARAGVASGLATVDARVQAIINQRFASQSAAPTGPVFNEAVVSAVNPSHTVAIKARLQARVGELDASKTTATTRLAVLNALTGDAVTPEVTAEKTALQASITAADAEKAQLQEQLASNDLLTPLLTEYHALSQPADPSTTPAQAAARNARKMELLAQLRNDFSISNPADFFDVSNETIGEGLSEDLTEPEEITLETIGAEQLGMAPADLESTLGEDWQSLTIPQLQARIEELKQQEFSKVESLRAEFETATGPRREALARELKDLGQVGVTGVEASMESLHLEIESASRVKFAGQEFALKDLLNSEAITDIIKDFLNPDGNAEAKAALERENPEFVAWIRSQREALTQLTDGMGETSAEFNAIQEAQQALSNFGDGITLSPSAMEILMPNWGKAVSEVTDTTRQGIFNYLKDTNRPSVDRIAIAAKLNSLAASNPDLLREVQSLSAEGLSLAHELSRDATLDTQLMGWVEKVPLSPFITDPDEQRKISNYLDVSTALTAGYLNNSFLGSLKVSHGSTLTRLVRTGALSPGNVAQLVANPNALVAYKEYDDNMNALNALSPDNLDAALDYIFGAGKISAADLNALYKDAEEWSGVNKEHRQRAADLRGLMGDDGVFDGNDIASLKDRLIGEAGGKDKSFLDMLNGTVGTNQMKSDLKNKDRALQRITPEEHTLKEFIGDGVITYEEILGITDAERARIQTLINLDPELLAKVDSSLKDATGRLDLTKVNDITTSRAAAAEVERVNNEAITWLNSEAALHHPNPAQALVDIASRRETAPPHLKPLYDDMWNRVDQRLMEVETDAHFKEVSRHFINDLLPNIRHTYSPHSGYTPVTRDALKALNAALAVMNPNRHPRVIAYINDLIRKVKSGKIVNGKFVLGA